MALNPRSHLHQTAVHEAAHAAADIALGLGCEFVTIIPAGDYRGQAIGSGRQTRWADPNLGFDDHKWRRVMVAVMAGYRAHARFSGRDYRRLSAGSSDEEVLFELQLRLDSRWVRDPKYGPMQVVPPAADRRLQRRTDRFLDRHWSLIERLARRLLVQRTMRGDQAHAIYRRWQRGD